MSNWEIFQQAYQEASEEQKNFVDGVVIPECVDSIITSTQLDKAKHSILVQIMALFSLTAISESKANELLKEAGIPESRTVFESLQLCFIEKSTRISSTPVDQTNLATETTQTDLATDLEEAEKALDNNLNMNIAEAEAVLKAIPEIPHIRTMAKDMEYTQAQSHVPTYTSTQAAILNEGRMKPKVDTPSWNSETDH